MASLQQLQFLQQMFIAAKEAVDTVVPWPLKISQDEYASAAACESTVETGWGAHVPLKSNNVLGIKAYRGWTGPTVGDPGTEEEPDGQWTGPQPDRWCVFATPADCFKEQLLILQEPRYAAAACATTLLGYDIPSTDPSTAPWHIEGYIELECAVWSTGQAKGQTVIEVYNAHKDILGGAL